MTPLQRRSKNLEILLKKQCKYIGSVAVTTLNDEDRLLFVNDKILEMKDSCKGVHVIISVSDEGIKVLNERETAVKMAHGISCIAFSTYQPQKRIFAYVAKSRHHINSVIIQAHMFRMKKSAHTQEISNSVSKAFKQAYAQTTTRRKDRELLFDSEVSVRAAPKTKAAKGKRWAKIEISKGHEFSKHAVLAKNKSNSPPLKPKEVKEFKICLNQEKKAESTPSETIKSITTIEQKNCSGVLGLTRCSALVNRSQSLSFISDPTPVSPGTKENSLKRISCDHTQEILLMNSEVYTEIQSLQSHNVINLSERFSGTDLFATQPPKYENVEIQEKIIKEKDNDEVFDIGDDLSSKCDVIENVEFNKRKFTLTDDQILKDSEWYQPGFSREIAEQVLADRSIGSFFVRDSMSHIGCYVLTAKVPQHIKLCGVANFLIEVDENMCYKIKGFNSMFPSIVELVAHYGSVEEDIPCQLRLAHDNPVYMRRKYIDQPDNEEDLENNNVATIHFDDDNDDVEYDDPDYEMFDNTEKIMGDLEKLLDNQ